MKKIILISVLGFACALVGGYYWYAAAFEPIPRAILQDAGAGAPAGAAHMVLTEDGWEPQEVTIYKDGIVTFSTTRDAPFWPASNLHPSHDIYPEFDPLRPLEPDETWSFSFDRVGVWRLHDHVRSYYRGTIYVVEK